MSFYCSGEKAAEVGNEWGVKMRSLHSECLSRNRVSVTKLQKEVKKTRMTEVGHGANSL